MAVPWAEEVGGDLSSGIVVLVLETVDHTYRVRDHFGNFDFRDTVAKPVIMV